MPQPVVHFEIIGTDPGRLRDYFSRLFGWKFDTSPTVSDAVSAPRDYGFLEPIWGPSGGGIAGGVGGGSGYDPHVLVYVGVDDVEAALTRAEELGGQRRMGPETSPSGLVIGHFADLEGNLIGVAGVA